MQQSTVTQDIVIGGGLAGLSAACYLARTGHAVTVLERAPEVGGRAATDVVAGYALNRGIHALYTGGPASAVLAELGVTYHAGSPRKVMVNSGRLHPLPLSPWTLLRSQLFDAADKLDILRLFARLASVKPDGLGTTTAAAWIEGAVHRPRTRALLRSVANVNTYTTALDLVSADVFVRRLQQSARHPIHYVDGGWASLANGLAQRAQQAGARIETGARVEAIRTDGQGELVVRLTGGSEVRASTIVLAVPPAEAARLMEDAEPGLERLNAAALPATVSCLDVALRSLPRPEYEAVFDLEQPVFMSVQSIAARVAPAGGGVLHAVLQHDPRTPADPHADQAALEQLLDTVQPGWRELLVERRFLPRMVGSSILPLAATGGQAGRWPAQSPSVPGVFYAGDWVGPDGYLVDASLASARAAASAALAAGRTAPAVPIAAAA